MKRRDKPLTVVSPIQKGSPNSIYGLYAEDEIDYPEPTSPYYSDDEWDEIVDGWDTNIG